MKDFLAIRDGEIQLSSGLDEYMFGKTSFSSVISQKGLFFDGENFSDWTFEAVKSFEVEGKTEPVVFYCSKTPFTSEPKTLLEVFQSNNRSSVFSAAYAVISALTLAAQQQLSVPKIGAGGILIEETESKAKILFLPQVLFTSSCAGLSTIEKANQNECWINNSLFDLPSLCFTRATIAYTMLTGEYPFPSTNDVERNADILDQKFLPLELRLPNVSTKLAQEVNNALKLTSSVVNEPGKKQKGKSNEELKPVADFPLELLLQEKDNLPSPELQKELAEKAQNYIKKRDSKINTKRAIRRNTTAIIVGIIAFFVLLGMLREGIKSRKTDYTTKGLDSTQSVQAFLKTVNEKEASMLGNFVKGRKADKYTDTVSQIYVLSKQRQQYSGDNGFATPENYFVFATDFEKDKKSGLYGLTNVTIDGVPYELDISIPVNKDNKEPVTEESGVTLSKGVSTTHTVTYYLLHSEGDHNDIFVDYVTEKYTLTYKGNRWLITDIETTAKDIDLDSASFKREYYSLLEENNYDIEKTVQQLSFRYPWVPSAASIQRENARLLKIAQDPFFGMFN